MGQMPGEGGGERREMQRQSRLSVERATHFESNTCVRRTYEMIATKPFFFFAASFLFAFLLMPSTLT